MQCSSSQEIINILNALTEDENVLWCEPEYFSDIKTFNPQYEQQYYLKNIGQNNGIAGIDINVEPAWSITNGENIVVAVIDDGVEFNHEDMQNAVLQGYTAGNSSGNGSPINSNALYEKAHGMACAGIISANDNSIGIKGVANEAKILPVNIYPNTPVYETILYYNIPYRYVNTGYATNIEIAAAIDWARERADVISLSWGRKFDSAIYKSICRALVLGRDGKGCVVVASSGNFYPDSLGLAFPSSINGVISVGAIDKNGNVWGYSQRGNGLKLVAPSGNIGLTGDVITLDRMGSAGYNTSQNGNYTDKFGGTSAACPQVAGVAALVLSVNPYLTGAQVENILYSTARDLGPQGYDNTYGYGLVDAYAAVRKALNYDLYTSDHVSDTGSEPFINTQNGFLDSPDIWFRNHQDGGTTHQTLSNGTNYLYVRIHNRGSDTSHASDIIRFLYKNIYVHSNNPANWPELAVAPIPRIPGHSDTVICIPVNISATPWRDEDYTIYSRIESSFDLLHTPETTAYGYNVPENNNISVKQVLIANIAWWYGNFGLDAGYNMTSVSSVPTNSKLKLNFGNSDTNILNVAEITLIFPEDLMLDWIPESENIKQLTTNTFLVTGEYVELLDVSETDITLRYNFLTRRNSSNNIYKNVLGQFVGSDENEMFFDGFAIQIEKPERATNEMFTANAGNDTAIIIGTSATLHATQINEDASYRWYDKQRNFKYEGLNYTVTPSETSEYILEVTAESDGYRDLDTVKVTVVPGCIHSITPNPVADNWISVSYEYATTVTSAHLLIYNTATTALVGDYDLSNLDNVSSVDIEVTTLPTGTYSLVLVCDNTVCHSKVLLRQ